MTPFDDVSEADVEFCSECGEPVPGAGASDHCERIAELTEALEAVHDELKGLDTAMRGPGRPKYRDVERRIGNIVTELANEYGFGPPGSAEPPRGPGRKIG